MRCLETTDEVIDFLGGNKAVSEATGRGSQAISNWRSRGKFPPETFLVLQALLKARRVKAPASLWGIEEPSRNPQAA
jgi:hypothetical protein